MHHEQSPKKTKKMRQQCHNENIRNALALVLKERERQNQKWGEQNHTDEIWMPILVEEVGELAQAILHNRFGGKAKGTTKEELTHVAAVALQWLECMERNGS